MSDRCQRPASHAGPGLSSPPVAHRFVISTTSVGCFFEPRYGLVCDKERAMKLNVLAPLFSAGLSGLLIAPTAAQSAITEEEAHAIGVQAYLYFYSLVTMDVTRRQLTNVQRPEDIRTPANSFVSLREYPSADLRLVVRPNFDTLYTTGFLDMMAEPMIVSAPNTGGRYYLLPMLDMWTDVFASPGWRTTGTESGNFLVVPPGWRPDLRDKLIEEFKLPKDAQRIDAPTPYVWIIGRTKTDGPADYAAANKIQAGFKITPLSQWGKAVTPVVGTVDPGVDMKTPPKVTVD